MRPNQGQLSKAEGGGEGTKKILLPSAVHLEERLSVSYARIVQAMLILKQVVCPSPLESTPPPHPTPK